MSSAPQLRVQAPRRWPYALLSLSLVAALAVVFYPAWIIQPFRAQHPDQLRLALEMIRVAPVATLVALGAGLLAAFRLWGRGWKRRAMVGAALGVLAALAVLSRIDYFELMFHPDPSPRFVAAEQAPVDPDDMVLAVRAGGQTRAYPVRLMAYHHLVNDVLGGVPLLPTY